MKILDHIWFNARDCVGIVLIETEIGEHKAYIGVGVSKNEIWDLNWIASWGCHFPLDIAYQLMPNHKPKIDTDEQ